MAMRLESIRPPGFIYFVHAPACNLIKIGYSAQQPDTRFSSLKVASPVPLFRLGYMRGHVALERDLHARFQDHHSHGEWFEASPGLVSFVGENAVPWSDPGPKPRSYALSGIRYGKAVSLRNLAGLDAAPTERGTR